uniref:Phosphatidylinositol-glycan biosynthesis class W protein n=1 Tax=Phlebotomus kandelakii TaxID=1109342 RepID=A0A6B2E9H9_9DIPT
MDAVSYKKFHESFMQNNNGSSIVEVFGVIVAPYFTICHCINLVLLANIISTPLRFLLEFLLIVLFIVVNVTVASDYIPGIVLTLLVASVAAAAGQLRFVLHEAPFIQLPTSRPEFISMARALISLLSVVCILAVDFQCFPRRFAKTETYGVSLMDVGVGLYVFANGIVSRDGRQSEEPLSWRKIKKLAISISPLLVLGLGRSLSISATDYHEHISEYGVHWNFFVTLAFTAFFGALIVAPLKDRDHLKFVAIVIVTIHEMCLQLGLASYVLSDSRENILEANKEGIFSLPGYLAIYIASMYIQNSLRWTEPVIKCREFLLQTAKMGLIALCLWKMVYIAEEMFGISRRLANMGYVIWVMAIGTTMVALLMLLELAYYFLKFDKTKSDECVHQYGPVILNAINYNGLLFFLTANLLTGAINLTMQTMLLDTVTSVAIIIGYMLVLCSLQTVLYVHKVQLKFW